jgi:DNA-binding NarL/FixJ family response regulator
MTVRVLIVDDSYQFRRFVRQILELEDDLRIGEISHGVEAVQKAEELQPDLILLDIHLPSLDGIQAAKRISKVATGSRILMVSVQSSEDVLREALNSGAQGYVLKGDAGQELLRAVEVTMAGKQFLSSRSAGNRYLD